jgi:hypothetical protein
LTSLDINLADVHSSAKEATIRLIDFYALDLTIAARLRDQSYDFQPPGSSEKRKRARYSDSIGVDELYAQCEKRLGRPVMLRVGTTGLPRAPTPLLSRPIGDGVIEIEFATALENVPLIITLPGGRGTQLQQRPGDTASKVLAQLTYDSAERTSISFGGCPPVKIASVRLTLHGRELTTSSQSGRLLASLSRSSFYLSRASASSLA